MVGTQRLGQRWAGYKATKATLFWSGAACVVATVVVGFTWGGWVTGGTARSMAEAAAADGRDGLVAAICVDRFQAGSDAQGQLDTGHGIPPSTRRHRRTSMSPETGIGYRYLSIR